MHAAPNPAHRPPLAVIAGPTASGKSARALALAEAEGGVIINADASQLYADLRILTARPSPADEARAPHRLYGVLDGADPASAARWAALARAEIAAAHGQGRLPIVVGGTGLYLRTLLDGIAPVPEIDPAVRAAVRALDPADAHAALAVADPEAAARLAPADRQRVMRALEVVRATGRALAHWQAAREGGIAGAVTLLAEVVELPRAELYARCDARAAAMLADGAVEEVEALLARGLDPGLPVMKALGVRPIAAMLAGAIGRDAALEQIQRETRNFAKRQSTWFANQTPDWPRVAAK